MRDLRAPHVPPHCPNRDCRFYRSDRHLWRFVRFGTYQTRSHRRPIQRFRCDTCRRYFSTQTFSATYWLRRPDLLRPIFRLITACAGFRQLGRALGVSAQTVLGQVARLGRHCLLFHQRIRPRGALEEPVVLDGFESFEFSQYSPTSYHLVVGQRSHFVYGFTESELRRKGTMTPAQQRRRQELEGRFGRPDPRSVEREVSEVLRIVTAESDEVELHTDEHPAYPRALRHLPGVRFEHRTISSRAARTPHNPLFAVNLLDLLIRHCGANCKRETIAFDKRRQSGIERLWIFLVWRNCGKSFSEREPGESPAMRLGLVDRLLTAEEILGRRRFPFRDGLPARWQRYFWRRTPTRRLARCRVHDLKYAY